MSSSPLAFRGAYITSHGLSAAVATRGFFPLSKSWPSRRPWVPRESPRKSAPKVLQNVPLLSGKFPIQYLRNQIFGSFTWSTGMRKLAPVNLACRHLPYCQSRNNSLNLSTFLCIHVPCMDYAAITYPNFAFVIDSLSLEIYENFRRFWNTDTPSRKANFLAHNKLKLFASWKESEVKLLARLPFGIHLSLTSIGFVIKALPSEDDDDKEGKRKGREVTRINFAR